MSFSAMQKIGLTQVLERPWKFQYVSQQLKMQPKC
jgi:hypothetical protein